MDEGSSPWLYNMLAFDKFSYQLPSTFCGQAYSLITTTTTRNFFQHLHSNLIVHPQLAVGTNTI